MIVIVPVHNQAKNIVRVLRGYLEQSFLPEHVVLVFDRCTDQSRDNAERMRLNYEVANVGLHLYDTRDWGEASGFGAGRTRDLGLTVALQLGNGPFLFTDGDCIPGPRLVEHHRDVLSVERARISCGRRYDTLGPGEKPVFPMVLPDAQDDLRNSADYTKEIVCDQVDRLVFNQTVFENSWICWSCNLGMNIAAVKLCRETNGILSGDIDRVFNSVFDGRWGGEDGFVGLVVFRCGGETVMLSSKSWVKHIWHPRNHTNIEHLRLVQRMDYELQRAIFENRLNCDVSSIKADFTLDRRRIDPHSVTQVRGVKLSSSVSTVLDSLPDVPLLKIVGALCCSGYIRYENAPGKNMIAMPSNQDERQMLEYFVEKLAKQFYQIPFTVVGDLVSPSLPVEFDLSYEYTETAK